VLYFNGSDWLFNVSGPLIGTLAPSHLKQTEQFDVCFFLHLY